MKKIKVLETIRQGQIGGGESHVIDLVKNLDREQFEPIVLSFTDGPMIDQLTSYGIECRVIPTIRPFDFSIWGKVKKLMKEMEVDLVHSHGTRANSNCFWAANRLNIPTLYTVHGWSFHPDQSSPVKTIRIGSEKLLTQNTSLTICVSDANKSLGKELLGVSFEPTIVRYGIDLNRFNPNRDFADLRKDFGATDKQVLIGAVVRMTKQKDPMTLIKAFDLASQQNDELRLVMIGDGELKQDCLDYVSRHRLGDKVHFERFRKDIPEVLNSLDVYCLPSLWEGLPIGLLEAMAMNKAIVATEVDGTKEVLFNQKNGLIIEPYDVEGLSTALLKMADSRLRTTLGNAARKTIVEDYEVIKMTRKIEELYTALINKYEKSLA